MVSTDGGKNVDRLQRNIQEQNPKFVRAYHPSTKCKIRSNGCRNLHTYRFVGHTYLLSDPQVLSATPGIGACSIESEVLANVCLNYLSQPRYSRLLRKSAETFIDSGNEDIMDHHLLSYAAKYWDRHLDDIPSSQEMSDKVESFINSPNFRTCLQVQSLSIEGKANDPSNNES